MNISEDKTIIITKQARDSQINLIQLASYHVSPLF